MKAKVTSSLWQFALVLLSVMGFYNALQSAEPTSPPPVVHVLVTDADASEQGSDSATFTVIRVGATNEALLVSYQLGGAALNGDDYQLLSGTVEIPVGAYAANVEIVPFDDFLVERWESVVIALEQPPVWPPPYIVAWPSVAVAHIEDNDLVPTNLPPAVAIVNPPNGASFVAPLDLPIVARASDPDGRVLTVEFFADGVSLGIITNHWLPRPRPILNADPSLDVIAEDYPDLDLTAQGDPIPIPINLFRLIWPNVPAGIHTLTALATDNRQATTMSAPVEIKVTERPPQPVVTVWATDPEAAEPDPVGPRLDTATFVLRRTGPTNFPLTVFYRLSGTAANGLDYRELPNTATIPEGESSVSVVVAPIDDNAVEGDESVIMTVEPPICIDIYPPPLDCYLVGRPSAARAVIHDNDLPPNHPPVARLVRPLDGTVFLAPVNIPMVADARDFDGRVVSVEFFEGDNSLGVVSNLPPRLNSQPGIISPLPQFMIVWSNVPPGSYVLTAVATDNEGATGRSLPVEVKVVLRPELPVVNIEVTDPIAPEPGVLTVIDPAVFAVSRTGSTQHPLNVRYSLSGTASNGVDYQRLSGLLVIPAGALSTNLYVHALHDTLVEGNESVVVTIEPAICPTVYPPPPECAYLVGPNNRARAIIVDNDPPPTNLPPKVAILRPIEGDVFPALADILIVAAAADADGYVRSVEFFVDGRSIGVVSGHLDTGGTGGLNGGNTAVAEQTFRLYWSNAVPGLHVLSALAVDNRGAATRSEPVRIKVQDPAVPPVVTIHATDPVAWEGEFVPIPITTLAGDATIIGPPIRISNNVPNTATFTVRRSGGTNGDLVVYYSLSGTASNGDDYRLLPGRVVIPRGALSANILVLPIDDKLPERTETVIAKLEPIACIAVYPPPPDCYIVGDPDEAVAYIYDNDFNQAPKAEIVSPADESIFRSGSDIEIDVVAVDPDGWVSWVEFFAGTNKIGEQHIYFIIPPPPGQVQRFSMVWSNVPAGGYALTARAHDDQGAVSVTDPVRIRVVDFQPLPVVTIYATDRTAREQSPFIDALPDTAKFQVRRTGDLSEPLRVYYRVSGTASNGVDYQRLAGSVVIPSREAAAEILIDPIDDNLVEGTESVIVALEQLRCVTTNVPPVPGCYIVGQPSRDVVYILDNDALPNKPPTVALISPPNGALFLAPADLRLVAAAEDPDGWVATVEFFANGTSLGIVTNRPWIVEPVRLTELNGAVLTEPSPLPVPVPSPFVLNWRQVPAGRYELLAVATDNAGDSTRSKPVEIQVLETNHIPVVNIIATDGFAREGTLNTASFRVRRCGNTNEPLTVNLAIRGTALNGVDYFELPSSITIPAGRRTARMVVRPIDDNLREPIETVIVAVTPPVIDVYPPPYRVGRPAVAGAIIVDNDCPRPRTEPLPDGHLNVRLPMLNGLPYRLEASCDLVNWETVVSGVVGDDGIDFVEADQGNYSLRFYRVMPEVEVEAEEE